MFAVEIYAAVRRFVFVEGKSRREAARVFGLSRDTIAKMCRYSAPPGYVRSKAPERPKLGPLVPVIDAILESDKTAPPSPGPASAYSSPVWGFPSATPLQSLLSLRFSLFPTATPPLRIVAMQRCSGLNGYERSHP